jgi:hypothetical protein
MLTAVLRLFLVLLRLSRFRLGFDRVADAEGKLHILGAIERNESLPHAVIDNYSRRILAWTVTERLNPTNLLHDDWKREGTALRTTATLPAPTVCEVGLTYGKTSPHEGYCILSQKCRLRSCITGAQDCSTT